MPQSNLVPICRAPDCARAVWSRGLCNMHYRHYRNAGLLPTPTPEERFWAKVNKDGPIPTQCPELGPCWLWTASTTDGYGQFPLPRGHMQRAHRLAWLWLRGPIPEGLHACHTCDTPSCVNPDHLFLGTDQDNMDDASRKGRLPTGDQHYRKLWPELVLRGEDAPWSHLKEQDILAMRDAYSPGVVSYGMLGKQYGLSLWHVRDIIKRKIWKHI